MRTSLSISIQKSIGVLLELLVELEVNAALNLRDPAFLRSLLQQISGESQNGFKSRNLSSHGWVLKESASTVQRICVGNSWMLGDILTDPAAGEQVVSCSFV
jgi:hypothetical protein